MKNALFALVLCVVALPAVAMDWGTVASVGIIDESSLNLFEFSGSRLQFKPGATGTIVARYPVHHSGDLNPGWGGFTVGYAQDGVTVKLIQASFCIPVETIICQFGPTTGPVGEPGFGCNTCEGNVTELNFNSYAYYFEVTLTRATTGTNPKLLFLSLP